MTGRSAERQLKPHTYILSGIGQNFRFSELCGFLEMRNWDFEPVGITEF